LKYAKYLFKNKGNMEDARKILEEGYKEKEGKSEEIILAI
jgi:hypothetical protein